MTGEIVRDGNAQSDLSHLNTSFRAGVPQLQADIDRVKAESLKVSVGDVFTTFQNYLGSYYVNQFNKFGRTYQVYVQADSRYRLETTDINYLYTRNTKGKMVPIRTLTDLEHDHGTVPDYASITCTRQPISAAVRRRDSAPGRRSTSWSR